MTDRAWRKRKPGKEFLPPVCLGFSQPLPSLDSVHLLIWFRIASWGTTHTLHNPFTWGLRFSSSQFLQSGTVVITFGLKTVLGTQRNFTTMCSLGECHKNSKRGKLEGKKYPKSCELLPLHGEVWTDRCPQIPAGLPSPVAWLSITLGSTPQPCLVTLLPLLLSAARKSWNQRGPGAACGFY